MKAINVGDSGFSILRRQTDDTKSAADLNDDPPQWALYFQTTEQTHFFNCPFQLGTNSRDSPGKVFEAKESVHRVYGKHCSYRHSDFY